MKNVNNAKVFTQLLEQT